jgi:hypothetical protein
MPIASTAAGRPGRSTTRRTRLKRTSAARARAKFLRFYPGGFNDPSYVELERSYKWRAHEQWNEALGRDEFRRLLAHGEFTEISNRAVRIESRTNLLFSFEKMAVRDAVKSAAGQRLFAEGLYAQLHGAGSVETRFNEWVETLERLPRKQTRVLTWPLATVFGFIAAPDEHMFLKPNVTRRAARAYDFALNYQSRPSWRTYQEMLDFAALVRKDTRDLGPRDMIDAQSFIWVQGSEEYEE